MVRVPLAFFGSAITPGMYLSPDSPTGSKRLPVSAYRTLSRVGGLRKSVLVWCVRRGAARLRRAAPGVALRAGHAHDVELIRDSGGADAEVVDEVRRDLRPVRAVDDDVADVMDDRVVPVEALAEPERELPVVARRSGDVGHEREMRCQRLGDP